VRVCAPTGRGDLRRHLPRGIDVDVADVDGGAFGGQQERGFPAYSAARAGDARDRTGQVACR
jgi:hypothetical protein